MHFADCGAVTLLLHYCQGLAGRANGATIRWGKKCSARIKGKLSFGQNGSYMSFALRVRYDTRWENVQWLNIYLMPTVNWSFVSAKMGYILSIFSICKLCIFKRFFFILTRILNVTQGHIFDLAVPL